VIEPGALARPAAAAALAIVVVVGSCGAAGGGRWQGADVHLVDGTWIGTEVECSDGDSECQMVVELARRALPGEIRPNVTRTVLATLPRRS
jgi:hypothetical protein